MAAAAPALIVVADAGPIIHLSWLDRLDLLDAMFQDVLIPEAVHRELLPPGRVLPGADAVALALRAGRLRVRPVQDRARVALLRANIDRGETEALVLSEEVGAGLVLLDDRRARDVAERLGLRFIGTIGLLRQARWQGLVPAAYPLLVELRRRGFWVGDPLLEEIRRDEAQE
jgi:predicted nucleic acid-binding protein